MDLGIPSDEEGEAITLLEEEAASEVEEDSTLEVLLMSKCFINIIIIYQYKYESYIRGGREKGSQHF